MTESIRVPRGPVSPARLQARVRLGSGLSIGVAAAILLSLLGDASDASALGAARIVGGAPELAEPTAGALVEGLDLDSAYLSCSATLIGCDIAISTSHCFFTPDDNQYLFFQHAGFYQIESATQHPDIVAFIEEGIGDYLEVFRQQDISIIKLVNPVSGIRPSPILSSEIIAPAPLSPGTPPIGTLGRVVGFGRDPLHEVSSFQQNAGIKRSGGMTLATCQTPLDVYDILCWVPSWTESEPPPPGDDVSTCNVDSGGPLFIDENGRRVVAGITVGAMFVPEGQSNFCIPPVLPFDANLARHREWIETHVASLGSSLDTTACGDMPELGSHAEIELCDGGEWSHNQRTRICGFEGDLDALGLSFPVQQSHVFQIPPNTRMLRIAMNGIVRTDGSIDVDLYVREGLPATTTESDCEWTGTGNLAYCEFDDPAPGDWHILVDQKSGSGAYQIAVTSFSHPYAVPALGAPAWLILVALVIAGAVLGTNWQVKRTSDPS